ncbi:hypothetical protein C8A00DRAFT_44899 [Chaetomidium leptoderma]|uniref:RING-type domain-containing protein n=1 Tax=Chaetomidium leptoderma TaxID=669021 RepID=A0AAN6ZVN8_9PEZI|nr:hypothetical protein C8A00DRAFT_44899 [Chaetomidium leptoderma]
MSIQPLPRNVAAQIKSSAIITSLNGAACGLLCNSLDAGASKINISVDYSRGNCSVEDDGAGIAPASFQEGGGLGKLHYTSKYPPRADWHGKHGEFLASLAALSLLSIASHHRDYRTHNSLTIHNSRIVTRNLPAPPEQRILAFASGTRVVVRDLFGSMPVRVKQRALEVERAGTSRDFDQLIVHIVSLLLPWPGEAVVSVQDSYARRTVSLQASGVVDWSRNYRSTAAGIVSRTTMLLAQAFMVDSEDLKSWVPIGATASGISVRGCVSLQPAATKRVQFIAIGVRPLLNEYHSNFLYDDVNRPFEDSSFGLIDEAGLDEDGRPAKTQGFTGKELKPRRGIDRWPMFFLQIMPSTELGSVDVDEFLDGKRQNVAVITDLLQVMAYEFLKKHHFRPKSITAVERLKRPKTNSPGPSSQSPKASSSVPPKSQTGPEAKRFRPGHESGRHISSRHSTNHTSEKRSASPFAFWSRTKSSVEKDLGPKRTAVSPWATQRTSLVPDKSGIVPMTEKPLFDKSGALLRKPFDDADEPSATPEGDTVGNQTPDAQTTTDSGSAKETVLWVDPISKIRSLIDPRTGFAVKARASAQRRITPWPTNAEEARDVSRSRIWQPILFGEQNTIFQPTEARIPQILQASETLGCEHGGKGSECVGTGGLDENMLATLEGRISKTSLQKAETVAQVDQKFILAKVAMGFPANSTSRVAEPERILILIDQHAADERCKVESLLKTYFVVDPAGNGELVAQIQGLDKPLRFDVSRQDEELLVRFKGHFKHWGVVYDVLHDQATPKQGMTVEVQMLPVAIMERCRLEPRLLIELLRKEIWKLHDTGSSGTTRPLHCGTDEDWVTRFHDCPEGILDLINSRACRSAIMFNDPLTMDQCSDLIRQLAVCAFPFQCAHGRPSMVPLVHLGQDSTLGSGSLEPGGDGGLLRALRIWKGMRAAYPNIQQQARISPQATVKPWRSFDFFDATQIKLTDDNTRAFFESNEISAVCSGSDSLFLGGYDGTVRIVGPSWKVVRSFCAYDGPAAAAAGTGARASITHMKQVEGTSFLVTVAVWALDKPVKKTGIPTCLSTVAVNNGKKPFPISAFAATDDLTQVAVGFANGAVTVIRGNLVHDLGTKQRVIYESDEPITGVELHVDETLTTLFVATTSRILKLVILGKGHGQPPKTVEDTGCGVGCMAVDKRTGNIVVAREDAVYYYTLDGRGPPTAYEASKKLISVYQDYIALVSPPTPAGDTDTMRRRFWGAAADSIYTFTLIHPDLRIIAHSETVLSDVKHIFQLWGDLYMLTQEGKVFRYHEKSLQQRLEMMYQRNLYTLAVDLAQKSGMDAQQHNVIYRKYGDHLYQKGDYDGAMTQYIKAIDSTEPSQVIRKFLDTQRIHNLIEYLEELHDHHKATSDHTTLLLNCYAKLKDIDKLEAFIKSPGDLKFDLDTAISMCRQGGYFEQAAYLAEKHGEYDLVVDILIEDSKAYDEALDFIWRLDPDTPTTNGGFVVGAANAVQNLSQLLPLSYKTTTSATTQQQAAAKPTVGDAADKLEVAKPKYTHPRPRTAFSSFIDHPDEFIVFLEACLKEDSLSEADRTDLSTTLFEMYLHKSNEKKGDDQHREEWEQRAKALIDSKTATANGNGSKPPIENSNVLLLSHLSDFRAGTTLVKEQSGLLFDIFRSYTSAKDTRGAIKALRKYGPEEPQLYPAALAYLTSDARILDDAGPDELASILERIDRDGLMAPLQVVQTLSKNSVASMGMLKPYLSQRIERERKEIAENRRLAAQFRAETETRRAEIADLGGKPAVFQATRCAQCVGALELPAVHFLCKHSFHQRCLRGGFAAAGGSGGGGGGGGAEGEECPVCARDNATIRALKKSQEENAERHELFRDDLERSEDRFKTISEWFGRGVMGGVPSVE